MNFLINFMTEHMSMGGISKNISDEVETLWNEYKLPQLEDNCSIINADFGNLGSLVIRKITSYENPQLFSYKSGNYDYVSVLADKIECILWTDYKNIEPYNRQGGLYCDGASFKNLEIVNLTHNYREFVGKFEYNSNISFPVWGYRFNDFYNSIRFGICLKTDKVKEFISKLRLIIKKPSKGEFILNFN